VLPDRAPHHANPVPGDYHILPDNGSLRPDHATQHAHPMPGGSHALPA
jgi:hypothetical protein